MRRYTTIDGERCVAVRKRGTLQPLEGPELVYVSIADVDEIAERWKHGRSLSELVHDAKSEKEA